MQQVLRGGAYVPGIWHLEVANGLMNGIRRGRFDSYRRTRSLRLLSDLDIRVDTDTALYAWGATAALAEQHRLTLYDACYLELAMRHDLPIASLDTELCKAARSVAVPVMGL